MGAAMALSMMENSDEEQMQSGTTPPTATATVVEEFEKEYYDEDDVEETEQMKKLKIFPNPLSYQQNQGEILMFCIRALLQRLNTSKYPNYHCAAYCFAILQDSEPRTIQIAQESGLLQTICALIEECCQKLQTLKSENVEKGLDEKVYAEKKGEIKKYQSLLTTY